MKTAGMAITMITAQIKPIKVFIVFILINSSAGEFLKYIGFHFYMKLPVVINLSSRSTPPIKSPPRKIAMKRKKA